jgi:predicted nucleotidyltransferase
MAVTRCVGMQLRRATPCFHTAGAVLRHSNAARWNEKIVENHSKQQHPVTMRLTQQQKNTISHNCLHYFTDAQCWLFGSRTDDNKRGGDIDLYIETSETDSQKLMQSKLAFLVALDCALGEQKIDVVIRCRQHELLPIHQIAKQTGILLCP